MRQSKPPPASLCSIICKNECQYNNDNTMDYSIAPIDYTTHPTDYSKWQKDYWE